MGRGADKQRNYAGEFQEIGYSRISSGSLVTVEMHTVAAYYISSWETRRPQCISNICKFVKHIFNSKTNCTKNIQRHSSPKASETNLAPRYSGEDRNDSQFLHFWDTWCQQERLPALINIDMDPADSKKTKYIQIPPYIQDFSSQSARVDSTKTKNKSWTSEIFEAASSLAPAPSQLISASGASLIAYPNHQQRTSWNGRIGYPWHYAQSIFRRQWESGRARLARAAEYGQSVEPSWRFQEETYDGENAAASALATFSTCVSEDFRASREGLGYMIVS